MAAGRATRDGDLIRVDSQLLRVCPQPANGALHILNGGREWRLARETIARRRDHIAVLGEFGAVVVIDLPVAASPTAAVKEQDRRDGMRPLFGRIKIKLKCLVAAFAKLDILLNGHRIGNIDR